MLRYSLLVLVISLLALLTASEALSLVPVNYAADLDAKWSTTLCVKNYDTGASVTEAYDHAEHLIRQTEVVTSSSDPQACGGGILEASINSQVIGQAHIAWASAGPLPIPGGRHPQYGRSIEDLIGVFSISKFIQLWDNSTPGEISVDWMPCI